jgi:IQ calmodulin-binding motif
MHALGCVRACVTAFGTVGPGVQAVQHGRETRDAMRHQRMHIVRIQAAIRMWLARKHYRAIQHAVKCAPHSNFALALLVPLPMHLARQPHQVLRHAMRCVLQS